MVATKPAAIDAVTRKWIFNPADERAASRGYRFNVQRGSHAVWWIERFCKLYEGEDAGKPMTLHGCRTCGKQYQIPEDWNDPKTKKIMAKRADDYVACVAAGHQCDWQYEFEMRLFGWEIWSSDYQRLVRRFRRSSVFTGKKNKKTPSEAATALYVATGDGEPGQHVYLGAKDGEQAKLAAKHVEKMREKSPELCDWSSLNKTTRLISFHENDSTIGPLSSSDSKAQKAKEGLNGSVFIDEIHVVDRNFAEVLKYAGVSRSEPLFCQFSTAGDDPMSYGFDEFEYGQKVNTGEIDDDEYLFMGYFAPQDVTDDEIKADPMKYGKMANPAWGHTVREAEFMKSFREAVRTPDKFAAFKKYRLNIWQKTDVNFLPVGSWKKNYREFSDDYLRGKPCYAALDLARIWDTSAMPLLFPESDGTYKLKCFFWLPEATASRLSGEVKYEQWAKDGWIELTPGNVLDDAFIERRVIEILQTYKVQKITFDPKFAHSLTQRLAQSGHISPDDLIIYPQTITEFCGPTALFQRLVIDGKLHHDGNPCMLWQADNVKSSRPDANGNIRPVKKAGDIRTIDGPVATIMTLGIAEQFKDQLVMTGGFEWM